jgi:glycosyltransferase involved in cell wall biosynthesis
MTAIRVVFVSGHRDVVGGGQVSLLQLLRHLDRERFVPLLVCSGEGEVTRRARSLGVEALALHRGGMNSLSAVAGAPALRAVFRRLRADLVHCDTLYTALAAGVAALGTGAGVIFHARTAEAGRLLDRLVPPLCRRVVCVSRAVAARFSHRPPSSVSVVFNGVDLSEFQPGKALAARDRLGIDAGSLVIGYCGQLIREKGLWLLRDAFARLRRDEDRCLLLVQGRGPEADRLRGERLAGVRLLPFSDSMPDFYAALDVFVLPTLLREGLPRTLIEAMACGVPCIATPLGGSSEVILPGTTGLLVPPDDVQSLHASLRDLANHAARRADMGRAARERAEQLFGLPQCVRGVEAVYLGALA